MADMMMHRNMSGMTTAMDHSGMHHGPTTMDHSNMDHGSMDHGSMDHGSMDHSGMDHSSMNMSGGGGHDMMMMNMYFTTVWHNSYVLFKEWELKEVWQLALACVVIGIVAALYEGLKVLREHLLIKLAPQTVQITSNGYGGGADGSKDDIVSATGSNVSVRMCSGIHFLQTFLHMIQVTVSYLLMLVVMTYNVWLCISVVLGAGLGYLLFGWKKAVIVDSNEHCH